MNQRTLSLRQSWGRKSTQQTIFIISILIPMALIFVLFWIYPMLDGLWGSLTDWRAFKPDRNFIGVDNYINLFKDPIFVASLVNTFKYALMYLPVSIVLPLLVALAVEASGVLRGFFRTVYFLPVVTSVIATALIWSWLYQPSLGLFNQILDMLGQDTHGFLRSIEEALPAIVVYAVWKNLGYNMVLFTAGLTGIPPSFYDAAKIDGANRWQEFWHITVPLLQPTFAFIVVTGIINTLQVFGPVYVMTGATANDMPGGPANSTMVVALYQWLVAFQELRLGYGSAIAIVLFIIVLVVTLLQSKFLYTQWEY